MNNTVMPFGRKALQIESIEATLDLERVEGRWSRFDVVDVLVGELLVRSLQGERVVEMTPGKDKECSLVIHGLHADDRAFVDDTFRLDRQQARGAWFLPTEASLRPGTINFPAHFQRSARFASHLSWEEHCRASLEKTADALLVWALLEPLFDDPSLRKTNFVLVHGGWPFAQQVTALLTKPNVYADFSAQTLVNPPRQVASVIRLWLEYVPEKVFFGIYSG